MKIAVGPVLFEWGKKRLREFYRQMAFHSQADILYIGEVVCSKRNSLEPDEMAELARELLPSGKEIVFSTLGLVMNEPELESMGRIVALARELGVKVEANDMAGVALAEGTPMVAGPHITTYNPETLDFLESVGVKRVVLPVELSKPMIADIAKKKKKGSEVEVFAYGKLPLTFSARCYTARAFRLPKSNCQFKCGDFPDGMTIRTQEGEAFLTLNGVETMSDRLFSLLDEAQELAPMGIDVVRLSPQSFDMGAVVELWRQRLDDRIDGATARTRLAEIHGDTAFCNGYYHGRAGLDFVDPVLMQAQAS